jgi:hypothetical protein
MICRSYLIDNLQGSINHFTKKEIDWEPLVMLNKHLLSHVENNIFEASVLKEERSDILREKWFTITNLCGCQHETLRPA